MKKNILFLGLMSITSSVFAYDKQMDIGFKIIDIDDTVIDSNYEVHTQGTFYFEPVQNKKGPWNELAFLGKHSNITTYYDYAYLDSHTIDEISLETDQHAFGLGFEYFKNQYYVELGLSYDKFAMTLNVPEFRDNAHNDTLNFRALVGSFLLPDFLVAVGLDGYNNDYYDDTRLALKAKYVTALDAQNFLNVEANAEFGDEDNIMLAADYYPNRQVSVGLAYQITDTDYMDEVLQIRSQYFFNPKFALSGIVGLGSDVQFFSLIANMRF
jgi:hypothetical protein